jgi:molybdopterin-guanine dinucleotide biosynthesis protein A
MKVQCAAILAGGASSRMGREKALLEIDGQPLVARVAASLAPLFPRIIVVTANPIVVSAAGVAAVPDTRANRGPLGGIHAALKHFNEPVFVVACDMPFLNAEFIRYLGDEYREEDALVPLGANGPEHLHTVYGPRPLPELEAYLLQERPPSLRRIYEALNTRLLPEASARRFSPDLSCFENWNTPGDIRDTASS